MRVRIIYFIVLLVACVLQSTVVHAQDVHFSQTDVSPLTLNPALAGANASFQGIAMYRGQYGSFASPFQTFFASIDGRLTAALKNSNGVLGAGLVFFNDRMGDGYFTQSNIGFNFSYSLKVSRFSRVALGLNSTFGRSRSAPLLPFQ